MQEEHFRFLFSGLAFSFAAMVLFWIWGRIRNNYGVIDVGWGIVNSGIIWVYFVLSSEEGFQLPFLRPLDPPSLLTAMITLWGLRLSIFLWWTRIRPGHPEDKRYNAFRKDYGDKVHRKFFTNVFLFQGLLAFVLTSPFLPVFILSPPPKEILRYTGIGLFCIGLIGEVLSDFQLSRFARNPANKRKVCNIGLWKYSRHPNYFFEWVVWLGMSLVASEVHWIGIFPALFMYILLVHITGIPYAEKYSLQSRGEAYKEYQRTTSAFFPWFPQK